MCNVVTVQNVKNLFIKMSELNTLTL